MGPKPNMAEPCHTCREKRPGEAPKTIQRLPRFNSMLLYVLNPILTIQAPNLSWAAMLHRQGWAADRQMGHVVDSFGFSFESLRAEDPTTSRLSQKPEAETKALVPFTLYSGKPRARALILEQ